MTIQHEINPRMRAILIDWLVEVHAKFKLLPQTMYICCNILDRFLQKVDVKKEELQLLGCCCLWMASKFEEIYAPDPNDFVLISDHAFERNDLLTMEGKVLNVLEFRLTAPTHYIFLTRWTFLANADKRQRLLALYCTERTLQEYGFLKYKPSLVAAAALYVALEATNSRTSTTTNIWNQVLERNTTYSATQLFECAAEMRELIANAEHRSLLAVRKKYLSEENAQVAKISLLSNASLGILVQNGVVSTISANATNTNTGNNNTMVASLV
jgi:hypothetical protein